MQSVVILRYVIALFVIASLWRCGVDDDKVQKTLIGEWTLEQLDTYVCDDPTDNSSQTFPCTTDFCARYIFTDSIVYFLETTIDGLTTSENGTFVNDGATLSLCTAADEDGPSTCQEFSMILDGNELVLQSQVKVEGCFTRASYSRE